MKRGIAGLLFNSCCLLVFILCSGCSSSFKHKLKFDPQEPLRVAVLPFINRELPTDSEDQEGRIFLDNLELSNSNLETPSQLVRKLVIAELSQTNLDIISPALIDIDLPHHGFAMTGGKINLNSVYATKASTLCNEFLDCDAVLYGYIDEWERSYYGLQSVSTVKFRFKLVSAATDNVLFESVGRDSASRGITKIPTGFSSLVLEPLKGLNYEIISELSGTVVEQMLKPLKASERPEFLESPPPVIYAVGAKAYRSAVYIVLFGTDKQQASFSVVDGPSDVPMIERSAGHYYGEFLPINPAQIKSQTAIRIRLQDGFGRSTEQMVVPGDK